MRKSFTFLVSTFVLVLCFSISLLAQETTGEIRGTVKDAQGAVVPNVTITISGVDVGINRTAQSSSDGTYQVQQLPPGTYSVTAAATAGFAEQVKNKVPVGLGNATTLDFQLSVGDVGAVVDVTGDSGVIVDTSETKAQDNISAQEIERLPKGTGFSSLLRTTAAVRPEPLSGQFSINGSTGPENSFIVDGQETQNYKNGLLNSNNDIPFQAVQEIQVKSSGFEAEFGGATGGVINAVTKSGSNAFHGEFGAQFATQKLNAGRRPVPNNSLLFNAATGSSGQGFEYLPQARDRGHSFFPTAVFSGPIVKDKLWFFGIHSPRYISTTRTTNFIQGFGPCPPPPASPGSCRRPATLNALTQAAGGTTTQTATAEEIINYSQFRLDASPWNQLRLSSSFTWNPIVNDGLLLGGNYVLGSPGLAVLNGQTFQGSELAKLQGGRQNSNNFRVEGVWTPTSKLVAVGRYTRGFLNQKLGSYGIPTDPRVICQLVPTGTPTDPTDYRPIAGCSQGDQTNRGNDLISRDVSIRTTIDANLSYLFNLGGGHELKGGYQNSEIFNDVETGSVGPGRSYLYYGVTTFDPNFTYVQWHIQPHPDGAYPLPTLPPGVSVVGTGVNYQFGATGQATNTADTFFLQDKWQPTRRLTLNLGFRTEREKIPAFNENPIDLAFDFSDKIAPRLGVAYDLTGDGKTKLAAFYGQFFDRLKFSLPQGSFGGNFYHVSYFYITSNQPYTYYTVPNLRGSYTFPPGGQCPITLTGPNSYVCDQDYRIASNTADASPFESGAVDPDIKPFRQTEVTVEFQREVMRSSVFTARFLHRNLNQTVEDAGIFTEAGEAYIIGNPGQGLHAEILQELGYERIAKPVRKYNALQLEYDTRFIDNFSLNLNYTLSRLKGNYSGLAGPDEISAVGGSRNDPNVLRDFDLPQVGFTASGEEAIGILPLDRTHVFKASGTYSFDWRGSSSNNSDFSFFTTAQSGTPLTSFISIFFIPIPETQRGDLGRTEMFTQTDINLSHRYRFGRDNKFAIIADFNVLNVFNENNVLAVNQNKHSGYFGLTSLTGDYVADINTLTSGGILTQYNQAVADFEAENGVGTARNAAFNQPISYQDSRSVRFGVRFVF